MNKYQCPVCGYPDLDEPPYDLLSGDPSFNICPCCGCEYGYHDATPASKEQFLRNWVNKGPTWFKPRLKPSNWNVREQLRTVGVDLDKLRK